MIHVIKHDMDHNMDLNYRRKIRPLPVLHSNIDSDYPEAVYL